MDWWRGLPGNTRLIIIASIVITAAALVLLVARTSSIPSGATLDREVSARSGLAVTSCTKTGPQWVPQTVVGTFYTCHTAGSDTVFVIVQANGQIVVFPHGS